MDINFYSKKILKFLSIGTIISFSLCDIHIINKQSKAEKNLIAASEKDLFLYRQMGASYLVIGRPIYQAKDPLSAYEAIKTQILNN